MKNNKVVIVVDLFKLLKDFVSLILHLLPLKFIVTDKSDYLFESVVSTTLNLLQQLLNLLNIIHQID